jgi:hypothetical protein
MHPSHMRRQIFSPCSACVSNFVAHAQPAYRQCFSAHSACAKNKKMANICRSLQKKISSPQVTYSDRIYYIIFIYIYYISHLGTFNNVLCVLYLFLFREFFTEQHEKNVHYSLSCFFQNVVPHYRWCRMFFTCRTFLSLGHITSLL